MLEVPENVKAVNLFAKGISFPVVVFVCSDWEQTQVSYLNQNVAKGGFTTLAICRWCKNHHIHYQIIFPSSIFKLITNPKKLMCYLYLKKQGV